MLSQCFTSKQVEAMQLIKQNAINLLKLANVPIEDETRFEISAHYGLENFHKNGCVIISKINRAYCKKLLLLSKNQKHPTHHHVKKEESFELLSGDCCLVLNNKKIQLKLGKPILIPRGVNHSFSSNKGCVIEEVSTTHFTGDSVYEDPDIFKLKVAERKFYI